MEETNTEVECGCDHLTHFAILLVSDGPFTGSTAIVMHLMLPVVHIYTLHSPTEHPPTTS